jgi:hypothetical protein
MLQLAVCITVHVAVEWRWEEPLLAYTLAGAEIELHLYFLVVLPSCFVISHFMTTFSALTNKTRCFYPN